MKIILYIATILLSINLFGQVHTNFHKVQEYNLKGGCKIIGNNIVSLDATKPYNDMGYHAKKNDRLPMVYVDIDDDATTFSSSSANLELPELTNQIAHATLYWAATYPYEKGGIERGDTEYIYTNEENRVNSVNTILFKSPGNSYVNVTGKIIEDQIDSIGRPYLCYADVTQLVKKSKTIAGTYTVANMRATQGHILGGSSGGWMLMLIYENNEEPLKHINIYHGFQSVNKSAFEVPLSFNTNLIKNIDNATLLFGVLEGDERLKTDEVSIQSIDETNIPLRSRVRPQNNFFNSTITYKGKMIKDRVPNSLNTLGFDIATVDITDYIKASTIETGYKWNLQFSSVRDMFLLFFMGTEVVLNDKKQIEDIEQIAIKKDSINYVEDSLVEDDLKVRKSLKIEGISTGYYLITNVFSKEELAKRWKRHLEDLGFVPKIFTNPDNKWQYVYVVKGNNISDCYSTYLDLRKNDEFKDVWLLEVIE